MQPLMRFAARPIYDSAAASACRRVSVAATAAPLRLRPPSTRSSLRTVSACPPCHPLFQRRFFVDSSKPSSISTEAISSSRPSVSTSLPPQDVTHHRSAPELPSAEEQRRSNMSKRFSSFMDALQGNIFIASQRLNDLTGYSGIEALKTSITELEAELARAQEDVRNARTIYKTTIADRAASQREVTGLLARKDTWTPGDLERFTSLYRSDHGNEQAVQEAATKLAEAERNAEHLASKLSTSILSRYHEEQVWSDKIRRASTWGTWGLMGVNILLFFVFQFGFEPWRRARLVKGFEDKVLEALEKEKALVVERSSGGVPVDNTLQPAADAAVQQLNSDDMIVLVTAASSEASIDQSTDDTPTLISDSPAALSSDATGPAELIGTASSTLEAALAFDWRKHLEIWQAAVQDLFSDRFVTMRKHDVTAVALEGAASGAALVGLIALLIFRPS